MAVPSRKVLSVFILVVALVVAVVIVFGKSESHQVKNFVRNLGMGEEVEIPENPGWQGELSGAKYSLKPDPNQVENTFSADTLTDKVSMSLMSNYIALKRSDKLDSDSAQKLVDKTVEYINQEEGEVEQVAQSSLNIVADNGKQSIKEYGENLGNLARTKRMEEIEKETALIGEIILSGDQSRFGELGTAILSYEELTESLIEMPVPQTFVKAHLDITNGANIMGLALEEMKYVFSDPIKGLRAWQLYKEGLFMLFTATEATVEFIKQNNIIYEQGSDGYYLLNEI